MQEIPVEFKVPPDPLNSAGEERTVGFEFEFTGVEMEKTARFISEFYGGEVKQLSSFEYKIQDTRLGEFGVELDAQLLRDKKYEKLLENFGINLSTFRKKRNLEDALKEMASTIVPFEIITPPVSLSAMGEIDQLVQMLREHQAKGTGSSFMYAFGMHINPEVPEISAESLLNHLRAYVLMDPWIREDAEINMSRRITPYINQFEKNYIEYILRPEYQPDLHGLISDYMKFGNTRNRPLDMLPVFMHLEKKLTQSLIDENLTSSRPTFHYRLPNCSLEDPEWSLAGDWNRWVWVERLASDSKNLQRYCRAWLRLNSEILVGFERKWIELMNRFVNDEKTE